MKTEQPILTTTVKLAATVDYPYTIPAHSCIGANGAVTSDPTRAIGVCPVDTTFESASDFNLVTVVVSGIVLAISSEAISQGSWVRATDNGKVSDTDVDPTANATFPIGIALDAASGANQLLRIKLL